MPNYATLEPIVYKHLVANIACLMDGYEVKERPQEWRNGFELYLEATDGSGKRIDISRSTTDGKVLIDGSYGELRSQFPYATIAPKIRVSVAKNPEQIVKDIKRRFLPDFDALWAKLTERRDAEAANTYQQQSKQDALVEAGQGALLKDEGWLTSAYGADWHGKIKVGYGGEPVQFDITVPYRLALRLMPVLAEYFKERAERTRPEREEAARLLAEYNAQHRREAVNE